MLLVIRRAGFICPRVVHRTSTHSHMMEKDILICFSNTIYSIIQTINNDVRYAFVFAISPTQTIREQLRRNSAELLYINFNKTVVQCLPLRFELCIQHIFCARWQMMICSASEYLWVSHFVFYAMRSHSFEDD